jgi:murein DD-endopeptidase MepM/ murein hydrolase activator NlpD
MSEKSNKPSRWLTVASWAITGVIVLSLLGLTFWVLRTKVSAAPAPVEAVSPTVKAQSPVTSGVSELPALNSGQLTIDSIRRFLVLKTTIPERPRYNIIQKTVEAGGSVFGIAKEFDVKPETILWANYEILNDSPDSIRVGQVLNVPPVDGVYYQWKEGDTIASVASAFEAKPEDILTFPGNDLDLTDPQIKVGQYVMVPGGHREFKQWIIPQIARGKSGTTRVGASSCSGGAYGSGAFIWPSANHFLSGNDYWSGHLGIDIAGAEGDPVYAADSGVVTLASGGWNGGYGNVVMIDHGNGYATLYGHLSRINVSPCQSVGRGATIGAIGNTGNSFGAHLHFEVRQNGGFVNPWFVLP